MMTLAAAAAASLIDLRHSIRMRKKCGGGIWDRFNKVHRSMSLTVTIELKWATVTARRLSALHLIKRQWFRIPTSAGFLSVSSVTFPQLGSL